MVATRLLAVLSSDPEGPVVRHRWRAYERALLAAGLVLEVVAWPKTPPLRRAALRRASQADGVVLSSRLVNGFDLRTLRRRAPRLAFDFDDALPYRDSRAGATRSRTRSRRFRAIIDASDAVFAGNEFLAALARDEGAAPVILPTTVEVSAGPAEPAPESDLALIGWIGSQATLPYLEERALVLGALVAAGRRFRLRVIADREPVFPPGIPVETLPWQLETWEAALRGTHFGLAPLPDDPWTRGKCGLKVLQMLALGRPVVASSVGVQADQVVHGETGYLAHDREAFLDGIVRLMDDPIERTRLGAAGRADVRQRWSVEAWAPRVVAAVEAWLA
ncbi:MAG: glycosyltransferase [Planctomycetota bacterium]|nr:glycosyltransferase [Planctomycetota bacterium]